MLIGRTDVQTEAPVRWPPDSKGPDSKGQLIAKDPDAGGEGDSRG